MALCDGNPPNWGVKCRWGRQKSQLSASIWLHRMLWTSSALHTDASDRGKLVTKSLLSDVVCFSQETTTKCWSVNVTPKSNRAAFNCTQWYIWIRSNNSKDCSRGIVLETNYWQTRSIARPLWWGGVSDETMVAIAYATTRCKIDEKFNPVSRVHKRHRRQTHGTAMT